MVILYVDDCGIAAKDPKDIEQLIDDLRALDFELTREGDFAEFLGIKFHKRQDSSIELTQVGLIDKILSAVPTQMEDCKPNNLPVNGPLGSDPNGSPMTDAWNYRSVIGMLLYLSTNTRVDIAFAVSQVARFSAAPKQVHASAVKSIIRYLKGTRKLGMIIRPTGKLDLDLFVDADFIGLYSAEDHSNSDSARSRTGFIVKLSGCPLYWFTKLQSIITCSTTEAEYVALSTSLRTLLVLKRIVLEAAAKLDISSVVNTTVRARVFEDNQSAYHLATNHRITNRTRYFLNKWHWFWDQSKEFTIFKVDTHDQDADFLGKALSRQLFEDNRFRVQGW